MTDNPFIAGGISGLFQTIVSHPLDTIKTYNQVNLQNRIDFTKFKYFNGIIPSSLISITTTSITFGVNYTQINYYKYENHYRTGMIAGIINTIFINPMENYKVMYQAQTYKNNKNTQNIFKNMNKGFNVTLLREVIANSLYFGMYNDLKKHTSIFNAGGIAGVSSWLFTYPLDVIKSRVQSSNITYMEAIKKKNLWTGISYCLLRAYIGNAVGFSIYENLYNQDK
jgi:solute carrier family 25 carnitine/acylcarnitine transporter 20/29